MSSRRRRQAAAVLTCAVCGALLLGPVDLEGQALLTARNEALQHAQGEVSDAGRGSGRALASVNLWRVLCASGMGGR